PRRRGDRVAAQRHPAGLPLRTGGHRMSTDEPGLVLSHRAGTAPPPPAVATSGLTKRYRRATALENCTVSVPGGSICALVGPNGAGKTTLLRLLCGLAEPT